MAISIRHVASWAAGFDHLEIRTIEPERAPLPITETGYRSHFLHGSELKEHGGALPFVLAWLEHAARTQAWQTSRQLSLF
ncbi:hypothetical protein ACWKW0_09380 [Methylorubrum zatmanii]